MRDATTHLRQTRTSGTIRSTVARQLASIWYGCHSCPSGGALANDEGAVSFLHRFGSGLNRHAHLHACVTDGFFQPSPDGFSMDASVRITLLNRDACRQEAPSVSAGNPSAPQLPLRHGSRELERRRGNLGNGGDGVGELSEERGAAAAPSDNPQDRAAATFAAPEPAIHVSRIRSSGLVSSRAVLIVRPTP